MITAASVAVAVERVGMACTWPDSRSTSFWIMSKPAADGHCRQPGDPIHPDHPTAPRWQRQGMEEPARAAMLSFGALARLARAQVLSDVAILAHPEGKEPDQRPRLGTPKMPPSGPSWQSRSTCARNLPPAGMQWRSAAPCLRRQRRPQRTRNVQPFRVCAGSVTGAPCRSTSLPSAAAAPRRILRDPVFRPLRLEPRHRPAVCPQVELRKSVQSPAGRAPRCREGSVGTPVGRGPLPVWCSSARPPSACDSRTPPPAPSLANFNRQIIF